LSGNHTIDVRGLPRGEAAVLGAGFRRRWGVIPAGGDGKRLLPLTRRLTGDDRPKQFCRVFGNETLLQQTRRRVGGTVRPDQMFVVLTKPHQRFYADQVDEFPEDRRLIQPDNCGTAPAILYSISRVCHLDPNGVVAFFPSDHYFVDEAVLRAQLDSAFRAAERRPKRVILLGVSPDTPESDYGWIEPGAHLGCSSIFRVERFWEKPSPAVARALMSRGCLWNSFIMVGRVQAFLNLVQRSLPELLRSFSALTSRAGADLMPLNDLYNRIPNVNFSDQVLSACPAALGVLRADGLGWSDLGDPGRVLSILTRKGTQREWNCDSAAGSVTASA
jgi:mannose-1-phosphate guanylyltransferase